MSCDYLLSQNQTEAFTLCRPSGLPSRQVQQDERSPSWLQARAGEDGPDPSDPMRSRIRTNLSRVVCQELDGSAGGRHLSV